MHPKELQNQWNLSNAQLAAALGKSEETIKAYKAQPSAKSYRNAPRTTCYLCDRLNADWTREKAAIIYLSAGY